MLLLLLVSWLIVFRIRSFTLTMPRTEINFVGPVLTFVSSVLSSEPHPTDPLTRSGGAPVVGRRWQALRVQWWLPVSVPQVRGDGRCGRVVRVDRLSAGAVHELELFLIFGVMDGV